MEAAKKMNDSEIIARLLDKLRFSANSFAKEVGVTPSAIYHILNGQNTLSDNLSNRIVAKFPEVNYLYLKKGEEPMFVNSSLAQTQFNLLGNKDKSLSFDGVPATLKNIETLLSKILEKLGKD